MKVRETEIELLRIVIMILIIITHLAVWGTAKTEKRNDLTTNNSRDNQCHH